MPEGVTVFAVCSDIRTNEKSAGLHACGRIIIKPLEFTPFRKFRKVSISLDSILSDIFAPHGASRNVKPSSTSDSPLYAKDPTFSM